MKLKALLSVLLIAALLSSPMALMEDKMKDIPLSEVADTTPEACDNEADAIEFLPEEGEITAFMTDEPVAEETDHTDLPIEESVQSVFEASVDSDELEVEPVEAALEQIEEMQASQEAAYSLFAPASSDVTIDATHFPDATFRQYISKNYDTDSNGTLSASEIASVKSIDISWDDITTLEGINWFTSLESLDCHGNKLTSLDASFLPNLTWLDCSGNDQFASLNVSKCPNLKHLDCSINQLSGLDVSACHVLEYLDCDRNNLTNLGISGCANLTHLSCVYNQLSSLDVSGCANLTYLSCVYNQLSSLDVSGCINLKHLNCEFNELSNLNVSGCPNLCSLYCYSNALTTLNIEGCPLIAKYITPAYYHSATEGIHGFPCVSYGYGEYEVLCDPTVSIISGNSVSPTLEEINVLSRSVKATKVAAPGTVFQLNLGGAVGKKFKCSKKKVATVNSAGLVTVRGAGKAKITFKVGNKTRTLILTVKDPTVPSSVSLNMSGTNTVKQGDTVTLIATLPTGTNSGIKWKSNHKSIATVSNGVVRFKKSGTVTITATTTRGKKIAKVKFKVIKYDGSKDLSNYGWRTVTGVKGDNKLTFRKKHRGGYMHEHRFANGEQIFVNLTWREGGDAIAYDNGTYGYVQAKYIAW